jgi:hypothetical protein
MFLVIWKDKTSDKCPGCGLHEDARHVWICPAEEALDVWKECMDRMTIWFPSVSTDRVLVRAILQGLQNWCLGGHSERPEFEEGIQECLVKQDAIGWPLFFKGFIHPGWAECQQEYYNRIGSGKTGDKWLSLLIQRVWEIARELWRHRNKVMHSTDNPNSTQEGQEYNRQISQLFCKYTDRLPDVDGYLFATPLEELLKKTTAFKKEWLRYMTAAKEQVHMQEREGHLEHMVRAQERFHRRQRRLERENTKYHMTDAMKYESMAEARRAGVRMTARGGSGGGGRRPKRKKCIGRSIDRGKGKWRRKGLFNNKSRLRDWLWRQN